MEVILHGLKTDRKKNITCEQVQKRIIDFINDDMEVKDIEKFLYHIENCEECREEYSVYYTLIMGMKLLDSDNIKGKIQINPRDRIDDAKSYLIRYRLVLFQKILLFIFVCIGIILLF